MVASVRAYIGRLSVEDRASSCRTPGRVYITYVSCSLPDASVAPGIRMDV